MTDDNEIIIKARRSSSNTIDIDDLVLEEHHSTQTSDEIHIDSFEEDLIPTTTTRRVVRAQIVRNLKNAQEPIQITLVHQRRKNPSEDWNDIEWEDSEVFKLSQLKGHQQVKLDLTCAETHKLMEYLNMLAIVAAESKNYLQRDFKVFDSNTPPLLLLEAFGEKKDLLANIIQKNSADFWSFLDEIKDDIPIAIAARRLQKERLSALETFKQNLTCNIWHENDWQSFFENNKWIFGYGLSYKFLSQNQTQPIYGGKSLRNKGENRGDFLMNSEAETKFTILVEIKTPGTPLVKERLYRNHTYSLSEDLIGGVSQIQSQCFLWQQHSRDDVNRDELESNKIFTVEPKGILIIGNSSSLNERDKIRTFEQFRRNVHNPEIVTFDELYQRATFLLMNENDAERPLSQS